MMYEVMWYGWHTYGMRRRTTEKINDQESSHMIDKGHIENI